VPHNHEKYPHVARSIAVTGGTLGVLGNPVQAFARDFGPEVGTTLWVQDLTLPIVAANPDTNVELIMGGGYGNGSLIVSNLGPSEALKYRVTRQATLTLRSTQDTTIYLWTTYDKDDEVSPPISQFLTVTGAVFTPIPPNVGFAPNYRRWLTINASGRYDIEVRNAAGILRYSYLGITPTPSIVPFQIPQAHRIGIRPINPATTITVVATWNEKSTG